MSTDLRTVPGTNIKQTRFYGGLMVQLGSGEKK